MKYTREGVVTLKVDKEEISENVIGLMIKVIDTGIGIHKEDMDKLFQSFERLDHKENHSIEGTGLGLAITSKIVRLMKGDMDVESVYGEGSVFSVYLPQQIIAHERIGNFEEKYQLYVRSKQTYHQRFTAPDAKILVVDDNEMNLFVAEKLLSKTKIAITKCNSGKKCLELVCKEAFDIILLDHMMPEMDGIETLKNLRHMENNNAQKVPVIALTANAIVGAYEKYIEEGFDDYLSKPIESDKLEELLQKYLPEEKVILEDNISEISVSQRNSDKPAGEEVTVLSFSKETTVEKEADLKLLSEENSDNSDEEGVLEDGFLDTNIGLQYCAGSEDMYREFLKMYLDSYEEKIAQIESHYSNENWNDYVVMVHALKSTSLMIGGKIVSEKAAALEKAGKAADYEYIHQEHKETMDLYGKTVGNCQVLLESDSIVKTV